jgi:hypothetical protein
LPAAPLSTPTLTTHRHIADLRGKSNNGSGTRENQLARPFVPPPYPTLHTIPSSTCSIGIHKRDAFRR